MAIENSVSKDFYLRLSIVLTFSIAAYPMCFEIENRPYVIAAIFS